MRKLNQRKIRWIIREVEKGEQTIYRIAKTQNITSRWTRELYHIYQETGQYPYPKKPGRKPRPISASEKACVLQLKKKHPLSGAVVLEFLTAKEGNRIPHNRIHKILKAEGLAKNEPRKQKRRKWIRYQRKHSNSLWHTDWFEEQKDQIILFEDDASRFVPGYGMFSNATAKNAVKVLGNTIPTYGKPNQIMTDHGTQFTSLSREDCPDPQPNEFQHYLKENSIKHIKARVGHPQSNGKVEKASDTIMKLYRHFGSWDKAITYYDFERPHSSLNISKCETPFQAYIRKIHPKKRVKFIREHQELISKWAPEYLGCSD